MNNQKILNNYIGSSNMSDWNLTDWLIDWLFKILECAWLRRFFGFFSWTTYLRAYLLFCFLIIVVCCDEVIHVALFKLCLQNKQKQNTYICHWYGYPAKSLLSSLTFHNVIVFQFYSRYFKMTRYKYPLTRYFIHDHWIWQLQYRIDNVS